MNAKRIWIHVGLVALFAGGAAAGILYHHHVMHPHDTLQLPDGQPRRGHDATPFVDHFRKRLDLSDEQAAKVKSILDGLHTEMKGLTTDFHDKFNTLRSRAWTDIRASLNETQRATFEKLVEEMEREHSRGARDHDAEH